MSGDEEEARIRRAVVNTAVDNLDVLTESQALNRRVAVLAHDAHLEAQRLKDQLVKLRVSSQSVTRAGRLWARERKVVHGAVANYQRLTALMESPTLVAECVASGMYHEAILVTEHILSYASPEDPFFVSLGQELWSTLTSSLDTVVLPRLAGPLTVDGAFKLITFTQRLGFPNDTLKLVFLAQRSLHLEELRRSADAAGGAYACLTSHLSVYKVNVCEVVLQYTSCFDEQSGAGEPASEHVMGSSPLADWAREQARRLLSDCERLLPGLTNGSELALVMEQCATCCMTAASAHVDVRTALSSLVAERVKTLFSQHMAVATQTFQASMVTFTLSDPASHPTATAASSRDVVLTPGAPRPAPLQLTSWLPLSYALNGALTAFNAVRKCVVPGVQLHCASEVVLFIHLTSEAVGRDTDLLASMDQVERSTLQSLAQAFVDDFYGYLLQCVEMLLGGTVASWVRDATVSDVARLAHLMPHASRPSDTVPSGPSARALPTTPSPTRVSASTTFEAVKALLPRAKTAEHKAKRMELFKLLDKDGSGALTFDEVYKGFVTQLHLNQYTTRLRDISRRAFDSAKAMGTKDRGAGADDLVEFLEFRLMLCYLYDYFELSALFEQADTSGDRLLDESELVAMAPRLREWGLALDDPHAVFRSIDENGSGKLTFDEFVSWAVSHKLAREGDPDAVAPQSAMHTALTAAAQTAPTHTAQPSPTLTTAVPGTMPSMRPQQAVLPVVAPASQSCNSAASGPPPSAPRPQALVNPFAPRPQ